MSSSLHLGKVFFSTIELFPTIRHLHNKSNTVSTQEICQMAFCLLVHVLIHLKCKKTGRQWSSTSECHRLRSCYQCLHLGSTIDWWLVNQPGKFPPKKSHRCYLSDLIHDSKIYWKYHWLRLFGPIHSQNKWFVWCTVVFSLWWYLMLSLGQEDQ